MLRKSVPLILAAGIAGAGLLVGGIYDDSSSQQGLFLALLAYLGTVANVSRSRAPDAATARALDAGVIAIAGLGVMSVAAFSLPV